jgi:hypothetical protein
VHGTALYYSLLCPYYFLLLFLLVLSLHPFPIFAFACLLVHCPLTKTCIILVQLVSSHRYFTNSTDKISEQNTVEDIQIISLILFLLFIIFSSFFLFSFFSLCLIHFLPVVLPFMVCLSGICDAIGNGKVK